MERSRNGNHCGSVQGGMSFVEILRVGARQAVLKAGCRLLRAWTVLRSVAAAPARYHFERDEKTRSG